MSVLIKTSIFLFLLIGSSPFLGAQNEGEEKRVIITNEATVNTENLEYSPAFFEDGIVFISTKISKKRYKVKDKRLDKNIMSIFQSKRGEAGNSLTTPLPFAEELLSTVHEGPLTFDRTADNIYFTRNNYKDGKKKKAKDGIVKLKIYTASKFKDAWDNIEELSFNDDDSNTAHPAISVDGKFLYFASDRPGGMGGMDIWVCKRRGDDWGTPTNLGPMINTDGDEIFPFIHADGTLYFASSGHMGLGGLDIFYSQSDNNATWMKPTSMGKPFNTENDDFGFIVDRDKKNGYFSSNRPGGLGGDDIYSFYALDNLDLLSGNLRRNSDEARSIELAVIDEETGDFIEGATVNYILVDELTLAKALVNNSNDQLNNNELLLRLPFEEGNMKGVTDSNGIYPANVTYANYIFNIEKPGYQSRQVVLTDNSEVKQFLVTMAKGSPYSGVVSGTTPGTTSGTTTGSISNTTSTPSTSTSGYSPDSGTTLSTSAGTIGANLSDLGVSTIQEGTVIELPNIYYNFNDARIRSDAKVDLDVVAGLLNRYPDMEIELASHTDSRGDDRYNNRLSQKRAESAVAYLVAQGIDQSRLIAKGYGEQEIRNSCVDGTNCEEAEHQYNRRTEVRITRMAQAVNLRFVNNTAAPSSSNSPSTSTNYSTNNGQVLVITGIFNNYPNAQKRLGQVQDLGFGSAEIVDFQNNKHMVVAGRYYSRGEAEGAASALNDGGIKTYIKE